MSTDDRPGPSTDPQLVPDLLARIIEVRGHIEDMGDDERLWMLGALAGAMEALRRFAPDLPWRAGRHNPRTIYAVPADDLDGDGMFIGALDSAEITAEAVAAHNYRLAMSQGTDHSSE